jgi:hypothetical protein
MFDFLKIPQHVAISYFRRLETSYFENPYANSIGALDCYQYVVVWYGMAWYTRRTVGLVIVRCALSGRYHNSKHGADVLASMLFLVRGLDR